MALIPVLIGVNGICSGEHFVLIEGVPAAVGRSSSCEVCLQRAPRFLALSDEQRAKLLDFNVISRRHLTVTVNGSIATLENHSASGTWCNDARFDKTKQVDLVVNRVSLRLGPVETFELMLLDQAGLDQLQSRTAAIQLTTTRLSKDDGRPTAPVTK